MPGGETQEKEKGEGKKRGRRRSLRLKSSTGSEEFLPNRERGRALGNHTRQVTSRQAGENRNMGEYPTRAKKKENESIAPYASPSFGKTMSSRGGSAVLGRVQGEVRKKNRCSHPAKSSPYWREDIEEKKGSLKILGTRGRRKKRRFRLSFLACIKDEWGEEGH